MMKLMVKGRCPCQGGATTGVAGEAAPDSDDGDESENDNGRVAPAKGVLAGGGSNNLTFL